MPNYFDFEVSILETEPRIWRRFLVPEKATFAKLHGGVGSVARTAFSSSTISRVVNRSRPKRSSPALTRARNTASTLRLTLRSSRGGQQRLVLPQGAKLTRVTLGDQVLPAAPGRIGSGPAGAIAASRRAGRGRRNPRPPAA